MDFKKKNYFQKPSKQQNLDVFKNIFLELSEQLKAIFLRIFIQGLSDQHNVNSEESILKDYPKGFQCRVVFKIFFRENNLGFLKKDY